MRRSTGHRRRPPGLKTYAGPRPRRDGLVSWGRSARVLVVSTGPGCRMIQSASKPVLSVRGGARTRRCNSKAAYRRRPYWARPSSAANSVAGLMSLSYRLRPGRDRAP